MTESQDTEVFRSMSGIEQEQLTPVQERIDSASGLGMPAIRKMFQPIDRLRSIIFAQSELRNLQSVLGITMDPAEVTELLNYIESGLPHTAGEAVSAATLPSQVHKPEP